MPTAYYTTTPVLVLKISATVLALRIEKERSCKRTNRKEREMVLLQPDPFLNELTSMYEHTKEKGSVWVTFKRSSMKCKAVRNKMVTAGEPIEYRCLVRATDGKKTISTSVSTKDHQRFQASYATVLKAHMHALKKRERKDKRKAVDVGDMKKEESSKKKTPPTKAV